jgi:hypothetical protein
MDDPMTTDLLSALRSCLNESFALYKTRLDTFCVLIIGVLNARTVNLTHLTGTFPGKAEVASNYRRLQRFFQQVRLDYDALARFIVRFMGIESGPWMLALDRTNWEFGQKHINILMLAICHQGIAIPLLWTVLGRAGNSSTRQRTALFQRFCKLFGADKIAGLTGDREFIGEEWMNYLIERRIPFILRLKENMIVSIDGRTYTLSSLLRKLKKGRGRAIYHDTVVGADPTPDSPRVSLACKRLADGELLILATNSIAETALETYRKRWQIETLFAACKTRGFNLEDTHISHSMRIKKLMAVLAIAFCWAHRTGEWLAQAEPIRILAHKRKAKSIFRYGFDKLRYFLSSDMPQAVRMLGECRDSRCLETRSAEAAT